MKSPSFSKLKQALRRPADTIAYIHDRGLDWYLTNIVSTSIFDREWDALVVLDACRVDLWQEIAPEYPQFENFDAVYSVASQSDMWMERSFSEQYFEKMNDTVLVTGNPYSGAKLNSDDFLELDEVWGYAWDDELGTIPPRPITDRAITLSRERSFDRMIVHYMQPHFPSIPGPRVSSGVSKKEFGNKSMGIWRRLEAGAVSRDDVWRAYRRNLRYVLDDVSLLIQNLDAESTVITSDHGNAFGENKEYGHNRGSVLDEVRMVPWVSVNSVDNGEYEPNVYDREPQSASVEERLADLGYK